jgi:cobalt-zinc-cadmium efflux system membrane fusion protein
METCKKIFILFIICLIIPTFSACGKSNDEDENSENNDVIELPESVIKENGITSEIIEEKPVTSYIMTTGEIKKDEDNFYTISSMVQGRIVDIPVKLGDFVKRGQVVAYIQNPEITKINASAISSIHENQISIREAQQKYVLAKADYERERKLFNEGISPRKDLMLAETNFYIAKEELAAAKERSIHIQEETKAVMNSYGVSPNFNTEKLMTAIPLTAMQSGTVTKKNITLGAIVMPEQVLFEVTDIRKLWLDIILYASDVSKIVKGENVEFISDSIPDKTFTGTIDYIQPVSNQDTQTYTARVFIDNISGTLQPGMYGRVKIISDKKINKPFLPQEALQKYGKEIFAFIDEGNGKYRKQLIKISDESKEGCFVDEGLKKGDKVVTKGSFTLKSEMLKSEFAEED